jgi:phosphonate transport system permease protein
MTHPAAGGERLNDFGLVSQARQRSSLRQLTLFAVVFLVALMVAAHVSRFDVRQLIFGIPRIGDFLSGMVPPIRVQTLWVDLSGWYWGLGKWLRLLMTTVTMAFFGTAVGTLVGGALSLLASRNLGARPATVFVVRRLLEVARTVPDLVWALIFLFAFGLGPLAGVLAILIHTIGAQGKLFAETNENADMRPIEGVRASGGAWIDEIAFGLLPQVLPNYISYGLWRFEMNIRSATIIGFVGAGGIGMELYETISLNYFDDAGAILIIVFLAVTLIDIVSEWLRLRIAGVAI